MQYIQPQSILTPGTNVILETAKLSFKNDNTCLGLLVEYTVDDFLRANGIVFEKPESRYAPYDRIINGVYYDDKVAINNSTTHTISCIEYEYWLKLLREDKRVLINSYEYLDENEFIFKFIGTLDFKIVKDIVIQSKFDNSLFFSREYAYKLVDSYK